MVILVLVLILTGSLAGSLVLWLQGAAIGGIVLGYLAGGWIGLLVGLPLIFLIRALIGLRRPRPCPESPPDQPAIAPTFLEI